MTIYYLDSAAGSNTSPYDTWAKAATTLATLAAIDAAGDTIYVASTHNETTAAAVTWALAGTVASPTKIICSDKTSGAPPATIATGAAFSTTGAASYITITGGCYVYGCTFTSANSTNVGRLILGGTSTIRDLTFEDCKFIVGGSGASGYISCTTLGVVRWKNCTVKFSVASDSIFAYSLDWVGGSVDAATTVPTGGLIRVGTLCNIIGVDLSILAANPVYVETGTNSCKLSLIDCKMGTSYVVSGALTENSKVSAYNCDSSASGTNYQMYASDGLGATRTEASIVRTGGAVDGASGTIISWKIVTNSSTYMSWPTSVYVSPDIAIWNETTGSAITVSVKILIDSATTLYDDDVWLEVVHLGTSGNPLGVVDIDSRIAGILTTHTALTDTSDLASWANDAGTGKTYTLTSTITPQNRGYIIGRVCVGKAATTIYVDPKLIIA